MEDKIEVNEYVRTDKGYIFKVDEEKKNLQIANFLDVEYGKMIKHSKQLINLVEVKDVIRYRIDNISTTLETKGYVEGIVDISDEEMLQKIKSDKNYHILEILTHEQFEANCYKIGRKKEI